MGTTVSSLRFWSASPVTLRGRWPARGPIRRPLV